MTVTRLEVKAVAQPVAVDGERKHDFKGAVGIVLQGVEVVVVSTQDFQFRYEFQTDERADFAGASSEQGELEFFFLRFAVDVEGQHAVHLQLVLVLLDAQSGFDVETAGNGQRAIASGFQGASQVACPVSSVEKVGAFI